MRYVIGIDEVGRAASGGPRPKYIIGIDEVGRGPLAGPVAVAAVAVPEFWRPRKRKGMAPLRDSKQLTVLEREQWSRYLTGRAEVIFSIAKVYPRRIDKVNVSKAANSAARRACLRVCAKLAISLADCDVYLDGGLFLGNGKSRLTATTMIKADEKIPAVAMASILAKVHRDRLMTRAAKSYPGYGFERHKGYATRMHYEAIGRLGITKIHRLTFLD
jgi:ribonuclease HII